MDGRPDFELRMELPGWILYWCGLELAAGSAEADVTPMREASEREARLGFTLEKLAEDRVVGAVRRLFRAAGCDPTRYRPSSEALLRRVLRGEPLPAIHPFVDLNNCLSIELAIPSCVVAAGAIEPPVVLRAGRQGEILDSMRGPFDLAGKPLLEDIRGPFGTPITDSHRVKVRTETRRASIVAYLPEGALEREAVAEVVTRLAARAGIEITGATA